MLENKIKNQKSKIKLANQNLKFLILICIFTFCILHFTLTCYAEGEFAYDGKGKRNPFIPLVTSDGRLLKLDKEEGEGELAIEGIIYDKQGVSYAIINGEVLKTGDMAGDYQVLKIEQNKVVFIKDGEPLEVRLKEDK